MADRKSRTFGVNLDGRYIERQAGRRQLGLPGGEEKPGDSTHRDPRASFETQLDPGGIFAGSQRNYLILDLENCRAAATLRTDAERNLHRSSPIDEAVFRTFQRTFEPILDACQRIPAARGTKTVLCGSGEPREGPLGPAQIGRTHCGKHPAIEFIGREGDWNPQNRASNRMGPQNFPERLAFSSHLNSGAPEGDAKLTEPEDSMRRPHFGGRKLWHIGAKVAVEKIENVVFGRVHTGGKG